LRLLDEKTGWNSSFEQLQKFDPAGMSAEAINTIRAAENAALQQLDIPFFTAKADTTTLCWQNGATLAGFFPIPAFDLMKQRVELLSETNLVAQLGKIRHALS
jgi:lantibiotic modifying enzyme